MLLLLLLETALCCSLYLRTLRSLVASFMSLFTEEEAGPDVDMRSGAHLPGGGTRTEDLPSPLLLLRDEEQTCTVVTSTEEVCVDVAELQKHTLASSRVAADLFSVHRVCSTGLLGAAAVQHLSFCSGTFISTAEGNTVWTVNSSPRSCKYLDSTHCFSSINLTS